MVSLVGIGETEMLNTPIDLTMFLITIICWLVSFRTSIKIRKNILTWEKIVPKLDAWAQDLEDLPSNSSSKSEILEDEQNI
jgi:hypothetical protein